MIMWWQVASLAQCGGLPNTTGTPIAFIVITIVCFVFAERRYSYTEKQRYDGWFNNLAHPDWGSVGE
jgi:tryptophan-rich sensory protein